MLYIKNDDFIIYTSDWNKGHTINHLSEFNSVQPKSVKTGDDIDITRDLKVQETWTLEWMVPITRRLLGTKSTKPLTSRNAQMPTQFDIQTTIRASKFQSCWTEKGGLY